VVARILIIEDNVTNLELMVYLLEAFGYSPVCARDGEAGIEIAQRETFSLIICDIQMPIIDGFEVARRLKSDSATSTIPLIAVTAFAMVGDRDRVLASGFDGYVAKPIVPAEFVGQIEQYIRNDERGKRRSPERVVDRHEEAAAGSGLRILVVDDRATNRDLALSILQPSGYEVVVADGMSEGLAKAKQSLPHLILSDVCMSQGSGFEFISLIKNDAELNHIPFIFITSTMMDEADRERGLALGADRYLFRPTEPLTLLAEIGACLAGSRG
jgi:two-component system cell cycle response regulator